MPRPIIPFAWCRRAISRCRGRWWRICTILASALAALLVASWFAIDWTEAGTDEYPGGVVLRNDAGEVLRVSLGPGDVDCRPYYAADPEDWIVKALVAAEDGSFWTHCGVRPLSILRAFCQNVFYRRRISGASTITMQAVRLIRPHPKTLWWKFKEAVMALKMERAKDKRWILSQYLNRAPYGSNFVGIEAASSGWFGKSAKQLGIGEAAMLAGMVQAPSRFRPDRGYDRAFKRRDYVLSRMLATGIITQQQFEGAKSVVPVVCRAPRPFRHPYYCDWALAHLGRDRAAQRRSGDFRTPLDERVQAITDGAIGEAAKRDGCSVAAVVMRVRDGAVLALGCSGDYFNPDAGQVNTALAPRHAGSTLKPFLTALALDLGYVAPDEQLVDLPVVYSGYRPVNFDGTYRGRVSLRESLVLSLNIPFVKLLKEIGVERFADTLADVGLAHFSAPAESYGLGMALGNVEVTLLELVNAYAAVARGGMYLPPAAVVDEPRKGHRVFSAAAAYLVSEMLSGEERSAAAFGHIADVELPRFAWKTGTSSAYRDAWTVAWNPEYVIGVWCGHKTGNFNDERIVGAKAAAPVAWTIARALYPQRNAPWFVRPGDLVDCRVCERSGLPAGAGCPCVREGLALEGRASARLCEEHRIGVDGRLKPSATKELRILSPADGSRFTLVAGMPQQRIVCRVAGNAADSKLWWFVDGKLVGETEGGRPLNLEMTVGEHRIVCSNADGETAAVKVSVSQK